MSFGFKDLSRRANAARKACKMVRPVRDIVTRGLNERLAICLESFSQNEVK